MSVISTLTESVTISLYSKIEDKEREAKGVLTFTGTLFAAEDSAWFEAKKVKNEVTKKDDVVITITGGRKSGTSFETISAKVRDPLHL